MKRDYYEVLGIDKNADASAIKKAYRKLAKKYHPDTNKDDPNAEQKFKEVTEAYSVLNDPEKKKLYDQYGMAAFEEGFSEEQARRAANGGEFSGFHFENGEAGDFWDDMFGQFFGGNSRGNASGHGFGGDRFYREFTGGNSGSHFRGGRDVEAEVTVDFDEAALGCEKVIRLSGNDGKIQSFKVRIPAGTPIRRYPDLQIHRIIKENLRGRYNEARREHYESLLPVIATETSRLERRADEVEREVDKLKKVEYMSRHEGEIFEGMISSVTGWGLYVELPNTIEGLVHISTIQGDYYHFVEETYELVGERTNRHYKLGQRVKVMVEDCDTMARTIDFVLAEDEDE